jgi:uncharacterized protein
MAGYSLDGWLVMDWTVYWFMFPACIAIATVAIFSGISGAAFLTPLFLIGFPLMDVPRLTTVGAIGTALFLETSGFGMGVYRYWKLRLPDMGTVYKIGAVTLPLGLLGAILAHHAPAQLLRIGYGFCMLAVAWILHRGHAGSMGHVQRNCHMCGSNAGSLREITAADGQVYRFCPHGGMLVQRIVSGTGALLAGLISAGVGEATLPLLIRRSEFPVPVAAATSTLIVAATVIGAAGAHMVQLAMVGGWSAIPWNLIVWAVPGALIGASIGPRFQGRIDDGQSRRFFAVMFMLIGVTFLVAFTLFTRRFA